MKCPNCNKPNLDDLTICQSCSHELVSEKSEEPSKKNSRSKYAKTIRCSLYSIWNIIFGIAIINFELLSIGIIGLVGILGFIIHVKLKVIPTPDHFKRICQIFAILCFVCIALGIVFYVDAPAIEDDYTIDDLPLSPPDYAESYTILQTLNTDKQLDGVHTNGLTVEDVKIIEGISENIKNKTLSEERQIMLDNEIFLQEAWERAITGRTAITKLAGFEQIADLSELDLYKEIIPPNNFKYLVKIYSYHLVLQCEKDNTDKSIAVLKEMDAVFKKLSVNARDMVIRIICFGGEGANLRTANYLANHRNTSEEQISLLANYFKPLTIEHCSLRNAFIAEYLTFKFAFKDFDKKPSNLFFKMRNKRSAKTNSSLRLYRNALEDILKKNNYPQEMLKGKVSVWPWNSFRPEVSFNNKGEIQFWYRYYNPGGSEAISQSIQTANNVNILRTKHLIYDDLLQIVLGFRLGREVDLSARAYGDEYIVDIDREMIYSPGPDGEAFTDDDIKLYINPEVLGLK